jgi:hypothetical protein
MNNSQIGRRKLICRENQFVKDAVTSSTIVLVDAPTAGKQHRVNAAVEEALPPAAENH